MKHSIKFQLIAFFAMLFIGGLLTCCSDDKDELDSDSVASMLVGTWRWDTSEGYCQFIFSANGSYSYGEYSTNGKGEYEETGTYILRADKFIDCKYYDSDSKETEIDTWTIQQITKDRLVLTIEYDDDVWDMRKIK